MRNKEKPGSNGLSEAHDGGFADIVAPNLKAATGMLAPILSANIALLNWNAKNCGRLAAGYKQWFEFVGHRLEEEASLAVRMQAAKDPQEVARAYSDFAEKAAKDYQAELSALTKLSSDLSNDATDALQDVSVTPDNGAAMGE
jgi:uncharacterized phage infection (PIP) family protein YhgE